MEEKYDVIVMGSGLGGLVSAIVLAKEGYKVCVIEKNRQFGGNLQTFARDKVVFDTGVHYIGGLSKGQNLYRYFKYLGIMDDLPLKRMNEEAYDIITFDDDEQEYYHAQDYERFINSLLEQFPDEEEAIRAYCKKMIATCNEFDLYHLRYTKDAYKSPELLQESIKEVIESITDNERLRAVLLGSNLLYAGDGDITPWYIHALSVNSYISSAYRVLRGGSQLTKLLLKQLRALGGNALKRQEVVQIDTIEKRVTKIHTSAGKTFVADFFISNFDPKKTLAMLPKELFRKSYLKRVKGIEPTIGAFSLYLVIKPKAIKYINSNYYHLRDADTVWNTMNYTDESWPKAYMISMGASEGEWTNNITVLTYMKYEEVERWAETFNTEETKGERGQSYEEFKAEKAEVLIKELEKKFPNIRENIEAIYTSTPLSYRDYIGSTTGAMYGYVRETENPLRTFIAPRTQLENLFFTGQSLNIHGHGILGVTIGGVLTCSEILGREYLLDKIVKETKDS